MQRIVSEEEWNGHWQDGFIKGSNFDVRVTTENLKKIIIQQINNLWNEINESPLSSVMSIHEATIEKEAQLIILDNLIDRLNELSIPLHDSSDQS